MTGVMIADPCRVCEDESAIPAEARIHHYCEDVKVEHLDGVPWYEAPVPPLDHECWSQTVGWIGLNQWTRCACGALGKANLRTGRFDWDYKNERASS